MVPPLTDVGHVVHAGATIGNVQNVMGIIYSSVSYQGMFNFVTVMPVVASERLVLYRQAPAHLQYPTPFLGLTRVVLGFILGKYS
jgi:hypothetical protein